MDMDKLNKEFEKTKVQVFITGKRSLFMGTILAHMEFEWDDTMPTAAVDPETLYWSPTFFKECNERLRVNTLVHELEHVARLHFLRGEGKDQKTWNIACDIRINSDMIDDGYDWSGFNCYRDTTGEFKGMSEEEIYRIILEDPTKIKGESSFGVSGSCGDMTNWEKKSPMEQVNLVVQAMQVVKANLPPEDSGYSSAFPGHLEDFIRDFLNPKVSWEKELRKFTLELGTKRRSMDRPNRRYNHVILPRRKRDLNAFGNIHYYVDSSGSVDRDQSKRIGSEIKYIWDTFRPKKMVIHQFTTEITHSLEFRGGVPFNEFFIKGRGGTSLEPVRESIIKEKPSAIVIFSDMYCAPMEELPKEFNNIPLLWIVIDNPHAEVSFGRKIHVDSI